MGDGAPPDSRATVIRIARGMVEEGLTRNTSGNVSVRAGADSFWITPTGMAYAGLVADDIPLVFLDGRHEGCRRPSSEWRFHRDIYAHRPHVRAVLHAHSPFAVSIACARSGIPAFHYMIARFGGDSIRCARYAAFGTQELSDAVLEALTDRSACLLANHGMLVCADDPPRLLPAASELEELCEQYWRTCQLGPPVLLSPQEMAEVLERFAGYGQQPRT
jgi:L-fuculose-phosphate aldolase